MKAYVLTNEAGKVVGHVRVEESKSKDTPTPGRPVPMPGHQVHEIEFPKELLSVRDPEQLHQELAKQVNRAAR
jgi:hypothetical protein